ncbi:MAG: transposase [Longispora sp.]|nr:transposase [Longispora sp. (in: high G+C Gram-positive bacteria)]
MRADNTAHLITAAGRRHELARSKAIRVLRELDDAGTTVTFQTVAQAAEVSRSWLYTQPDIRAEVQRLRDLGRRAPKTSVPANHRTSDASLLRRLETANIRNRELANENQLLRRQLAHALGQLRAAGIRQDPEPASTPSRQHRTPITIGPC